MLGQAATHYGELVSATVSRAAYDRLRREQNSLQFHSFRLERKLAKTEVQVSEFGRPRMTVSGDDQFLESTALCRRRKELLQCSFQIGGDENSTHTLLVDTLFTVQ